MKSLEFRPNPVCDFSSSTLVSYKDFIWKASLGKTALHAPNFVHRQCTAFSERSCSQELGSLQSMALHVAVFWTQMPPFEASLWVYWGKEVLSQGFSQVSLPRSRYQEGESRSYENIFSSLTEYFSTPDPSPLPSLSSIKGHKPLFGTPSAGKESQVLAGPPAPYLMLFCGHKWDSRGTSWFFPIWLLV